MRMAINYNFFGSSVFDEWTLWKSILILAFFYNSTLKSSDVLRWINKHSQCQYKSDNVYLIRRLNNT